MEKSEENKRNYTPGGPIWLPYVGKEVIVFFSSGNVIGVLQHPNPNENYIDFNPSLVYEADEEHARVEKDIPTRVSSSMFKKSKKIVIRPLSDGYLEEKVKRINSIADRKKNVGFIK